MLFLFNLGTKSGVLNSVRSALSFFTQNSSLDLGTNPVVARCFKSFYRMRPEFPRYMVTWDVGKVLHFLAAWHPPEVLSKKQLTLKTVTLIALTSSDRAQTIHALDIDHIHFKGAGNGVEFHVPVLLKHSRKGKPAKKVLCVEWDAPELDVSLYVEFYLRKTFKYRYKAVRLGGEKPTQLFLSHRNGKPVQRASISRWIREVLVLSGIDITTFRAGSTRSASSSAAARCGASPQQIVAHGDWSNLGTYQQWCRFEEKLVFLWILFVRTFVTWIFFSTDHTFKLISFIFINLATYINKF